MPDYPIVTGHSTGTARGDGTTGYYCLMGGIGSGSEVEAQYIARDSYTLKKLYVRVITNSLDGSTTFKSRINGVDGNQIVTVGAAATGAFEDAVSTDALSTGDLFCTEVAAGGTTGSITFTLISYVLTTAANTTPIMGVNGYWELYFDNTRYCHIIGTLTMECQSTESKTYYLFRVAATLSNLRCYLSTNSVPNASTLRTRINGVNGNLVVSITASTTGAFEDAVNSDNIAVTNNVNYQLVTGDGGGINRVVLRIAQIKSDSDGRQTGTADAHDELTVNDGETHYLTIEGDIYYKTATEANTQATTRASITAQNMYVHVTANTINGVTTLRLRKNGGDSNLVVSVGATATGQFEDTVNTDSFIATDTFNWEVVAAGSSGSIDIVCIGFEQGWAPAPPPALENKSANMGSKMVAAGLI